MADTDAIVAAAFCSTIPFATAASFFAAWLTETSPTIELRLADAYQSLT